MIISISFSDIVETVTMDSSRKSICGMHLVATSNEQEFDLTSVLQSLLNSAGSFLNVAFSDHEQKGFTRAKYLRELQSQLSTSSGYSSLESIPTSCRAPRDTLISCQSLGVVLLLEDTLSNNRLVQELKSGRWQFHHAMQLLDWENGRVMAKQDFYGISPELPLVSASLNSTKKNIIRYNLFVKNKQKMQLFYEDVLQMYPSLETNDFCCFVLKSTPNYEVQFSLKLSRHLDIAVTKNSQLVFQMPKISRVFCDNARQKSMIETFDPEGNSLLLVKTSSLWNSNGRTGELQKITKNIYSKSTTRLGDCSMIRTRCKQTHRSNSNCESDTSSLDSLTNQNEIVYSGCPIML